MADDKQLAYFNERDQTAGHVNELWVCLVILLVCEPKKWKSSEWFYTERVHWTGY